MSIIEIAGYVLAILMGLSLGMIGGGGSILTVPILVYFFGQEALIATTGSFFVVGATALFGAIMNARQGHVALRTGLVFALPSFGGVLLIRKIVLPAIPAEIPLIAGFAISKAALVLFSFAILMLFASRAMIRSSGEAKAAPIEQASVARAAVHGFLVGATTAFVGAGGGFLIVPALVLLLRLPMRVAVGTSLAIIAANSLFAFSISASSQPIDWRLLVSMFSLSTIGMVIGHGLASKVPEAKLKKGFGYFVLIVGFLILLDQIF